jgi:hypothetical protein
MTPSKLRKHDVVITTYNVVVSEWDTLAKNLGAAEPSKKKQKSFSTKTNLFDVQWKVGLSAIFSAFVSHPLRGSSSTRGITSAIRRRRWLNQSVILLLNVVGSSAGRRSWVVAASTRSNHSSSFIDQQSEGMINQLGRWDQ